MLKVRFGFGLMKRWSRQGEKFEQTRLKAGADKIKSWSRQDNIKLARRDNG